MTPSFLHLRETFVDERTHVALVILVRAEDVEIFQPDDFVQKSGAPGVQIEQVLRVAVHVQRAQLVELRFVILHARRAVAVSRGGRRIDEARFLAVCVQASAQAARSLVNS